MNLINEPNISVIEDIELPTLLNRDDAVLPEVDIKLFKTLNALLL